MNPIDNAWMLLKEVTLEDLRQAARTGGLPDTPERREASRGHPGIPAALSGVEPFYRFNMPSGKIRQDTAGQAVAERIMDVQRGRLNELGQSLEEGYSPSAYRDLPESMTGILLDAGDDFPAQMNEASYGTFGTDGTRHGNDPELLDDTGFDDSVPDPMTVQPPEVTASIDPDHSAKLLSRLKEKKPEMAQDNPEKLQRQFDFNMKQYGPVRNRELPYDRLGMRRGLSQQEIVSRRRYGSDDSHLGAEYGPIVQNPRNYGRTYDYDPFPLENRIQTQEPVEDTEFADLSRPPEGRNPAQMQQLGQELADFPAFPEGVEPDPDAGRRQFKAQANRAKTLAAQSAQQSTASPMDAAMQALGNRKAEEAARVPKPVQRRALNTRRGGRGRGPNSQRNRRR